NRFTVKMRRRLGSIGLIYQLANRDLRFLRIVFPFADGIGDVLIELDQTVAGSAERGDPPETFCAAEDFTARVRRTAIGVMFENGPSVLDDEHGKAAFVFGIVSGACAIACLNVGKGRCPCCKRRHDRQRDSARRHSGAEVAGDAGPATASPATVAGGRGLTGRWRVRNSSTFGNSSRLRRPK